MAVIVVIVVIVVAIIEWQKWLHKREWQTWEMAAQKRMAKVADGCAKDPKARRRFKASGHRINQNQHHFKHQSKRSSKCFIGSAAAAAATAGVATVSVSSEAAAAESDFLFTMLCVYLCCSARHVAAMWAMWVLRIT